MLSVLLEAPDLVQRGSRVAFRLVVRNTSSHSEELILRGREPTLEVVVSRESGDVVWHSLEGRVIPAVLQMYPLAPEEKLEVSTVWDQRREKRQPLVGTYVVRASLLAEGASIAAPGHRLRVRG
jgi:hypothetical protein